MQELKQALKPYVEAFLAYAKGKGFKQVPVPVELGRVAESMNFRFKTSFGFGSRSLVPWLACLTPGQGAKDDGVYPVLLFNTETGRLTVAYGVSATADQSVTATWPREWPVALTQGLARFDGRKYSKSLVYQEFATDSDSRLEEMVEAFVKIILDFQGMRAGSASTPTVVLHAASQTEFEEDCGEAGLALIAGLSTRVFAALTAKRLCILTGLAGSGKTKLAEALALWLCESPTQFKLVAVGADWNNNENLLGYADALHGALYRKPANGALDLLLAAAKDPLRPYFLILDEMNLSHVERYFADVLSAIESKTGALALHSHPTALPSAQGVEPPDVPAVLALPPNLFIIGTVNVDETTYMFSPKVLDRANVIEFRASSQQISDFLDEPRGLQLESLREGGRGKGAAYAETFVARSVASCDIADLGAEDAQRLKAALLEVFAALAEMGAEFGFRSAHEMVRFVVIHKQLSGPDWRLEDALDAQLLQKLMPRLHGSERRLGPVLKALDAFAVKHELPLSREKIARMQRRLRSDGFASFAEN